MAIHGNTGKRSPLLPAEIDATRRGFLKAATRTSLGWALAQELVRRPSKQTTFAAQETAPHIPPPKHLVIILADTLRWDYVSTYFKGKCATPNVDSLAQGGFLFENAFTVSPISAPAYASLWSGTFPFEHGLTNNAMPMPQEFHILPKVMRALGFHVAGFVANYYCGEKFGFDKGWDTFYQIGDGENFAWNVSADLLPWLEAWEPERTPLFLFVAYMDPHVPYSPPFMPRWLQVRLDGHAVGEPRCPDLAPIQKIWIRIPPGQHKLIFERIIPPIRPTWQPQYSLTPYHWMGVMKHGVQLEFLENVDAPSRNEKTKTTSWPAKGFPVVASITNPAANTVAGDLVVRFWRTYSAEEARFLYPQCVEFMDYEIGKVLGILKEKGAYDQTLLLFLSDHGEGLGDHNLVGHIDQLYDSLLRVPLIIRYPPLGAGCVKALASLIDVLPTLAALFGVTQDVGGFGQSLLPMMQNGAAPQRSWVFGETAPPEAKSRLTALRSSEWKLIIDATKRTAEFFELGKDPQELRDVFGDDNPLATEAAALYRRLFRLASIFDPVSELKTLDLDALTPAELQQLETLGYL